MGSLALARSDRRRFAVALCAMLLAAVTSVACYGHGKNAPQPVPRTTLRVVNQGFLDRNVYVLRGSERVRLGTVVGNSSAVFVIPSSVVQSAMTLRFIADPIGGRSSSMTEEISVTPGDEVVLTIPPS